MKDMRSPQWAVSSGAGQAKSMLGLKSRTTNVVSYNCLNGTHPDLKESSRMHFVNMNPSLCYPA